MPARPATSPPESAGVAHATSDRKFYLLFFLSGVPALLYQIVWQRALFTIYGVNIESVTIIVTIFMLGLGLGSLAGGWLPYTHCRRCYISDCQPGRSTTVSRILGAAFL